MTTHELSRGAGTALLLAVAACTTLEKDIFAPWPGGYLDGEGGSAGASSGGGSGGTGPSGDLPCEVAEVLATHCDSCHAVSTPPLLRGRADFLAPAASDPGRNLAEVSLERMQDAASPMPPSALPPAADTQIIGDWIAAGLPAGDCGSGGGGSGGSPYDTPPTCSSGQTWNNGDNGGAQMYPGRACNACHADEKPDEIFAFAGTVYPTAHEPDDCLGAAGAVVEFTDANDVVVSATTNTSGNFTRNGTFAFPVTVRVIVGQEVLAMATPLQPGDGDCNTCHQQNGTDGAPGRIILPF